MEHLPTTSDHELADAIVTWSGRIAAGEAELLALIGEFDQREAWAGPGLLSCAHWLSWRTSLSPGAAREKVRVARALRELSLVQAALGSGQLSYSQVRAITRVTAPGDEQRWIDAARSSTAGQLERLIRGVRRVRKIEEDAADLEAAAWRLRATKTYDADGNAVYRIVLPAEAAAIVDAGLEAMRADLDRRAADASAEPSAAMLDAERQDETDVPAETSCPQQEAPAEAGVPAETSCPQLATLADALVEMARTSLASVPATAARRNRSALAVQIDPLSGWGRLRDDELLPPTSLCAVSNALPTAAKDPRLRALTARDLRRHDLGREQRLPTLALRELISTLDGERCRMPGCTRRRKLHAHHVVYWSHGGRTDLDNMILLCSRHHTLVHQRGFVLVLRPDRSLTVTTPEGVPVLHHPALPWRPAAELDPQRGIDSQTLPPDDVVARIDIGYAVMVMLQQSA